MLDQHPVIAFLATRDGERARHFYENTLGLRRISDDAFAIAFDLGGVMLRIQKVETFEPHPFTALGWKVERLDEVIDGLASRGVALQRFPGLSQDARGVWRSPSGARIAWFGDPDGNTLSLTEP